MRRLSLTVWLCTIGLATAAVAGQRRAPGSGIPLPETTPVAPERIDRLERWLKAVARHEPGEIDEPLEEVAAWSHQSLRDLWTDAANLAQLSRKSVLGSIRFFVQPDGRVSTEVHYSDAQKDRLRALTCAADGAIFEPRCMLIKAAESLDPELRQIAGLARAAAIRGDRNYILRRGALLHADVGMLAPASMVAPFDARPSDGPHSFRMEISDGRGLDLQQTAVHWEIARMLLGFVIPKGEDRPAPGRDDMVRQWYRATAAWMQLREDHNELHITHARQIFLDDPDLLFLAACQKETFAGAPIQAAVRSAVLPAGVRISVEAPEWELREAERLFRRTLQVKPDHAEARLRFGRVLGVLGKHAKAATELRRSAAELTDEEQLYFAELFLGAEEEALGNREAAREDYERAAGRFPRAQSPLIALSQLARRAGDRESALKAMDRVFALGEEERREKDDPWWEYYIVQARNADDLLEAMRQPYLTERLQ